MGSLLTNRDSKRNFNKILLSVTMLIIGIVMIIPFIIMISASFKTNAMVFINPFATIIPKEINLNNYKDVFSDKYYFLWYFNSFRVVFLTIIFRGLLVTMTAYAFAKIEFKFKNFIFMILLATMMITPDTTIVSRFLLYKSIHLTDTFWALVLPASFDVYFVFMLRQFFTGIPKELSEAAIIDGCNHFKIYYKIMLPLSKPPLVTMILFTFIWLWNDYANPYIFINNIKNETLTVGLSFFQGLAGANYALQMAGSTLAIIPAIIIFTLAQKYFIEGIVSTGIKG